MQELVVQMVKPPQSLQLALGGYIGIIEKKMETATI